MVSNEVVIVGAARTPIGDFMGSLKDYLPVQLAAVAGQAAIERSNLKPEDIDQILLGQCIQAASKGNPARQVQGLIGIPWEAYAATINQQCSSAMRGFEIGCQEIMLGKSSAVLAAGVECMSKAPYYLLKARQGYRLFNGDDGPYDSLIWDGLNCAIMGYHMGITAENLAEQYQISREEQDQLAYMSHMRATAAIEKGKFTEEIIPVNIQTRKGPAQFVNDEHPRGDLTVEALGSLKPAFKKGGTVTPGNASSLNDGASAMVLMARDKAEQMGIKPLARVAATASCGVPPQVMGIGPAYVIPKALKFAGLNMKDVDYFEINEAFAAQLLACNRELKIDMDRLNANGSGIGLGHPTGSTGVRLIVSLIYELRRRGAKTGCASLCAGGGPGTAVIIELLD